MWMLGVERLYKPDDKDICFEITTSKPMKSQQHGHPYKTGTVTPVDILVWIGKFHKASLLDKQL